VPAGTPAPADQATLPTPAPSATSGAVPAPNAVTGGTVEDGKKKKRGFWSRLFGIGDDKNDEKKKDDKDKKPKKPGGGA